MPLPKMKRLASLVEEAEHIALISHINPDGDAAGSLLGLYQALSDLGKKVTPVLLDGVPRAFLFLTGSDKVTSRLPNLEETDLCILLDANDVSRSGLGDDLRAFGKAGKLGCIDHHPKGDIYQYAQATTHDESASSTSEMVYTFLKDIGARFTPSVSTALLTGIYTDTGGFQFSNTSNKTLEITAELMRRGARLQRIVREIANSKSIASLKLLGYALERMKVVLHGQGVISALTNEDIQETKANSDDISGIIGNLNTVPGVAFSMLLSEMQPGVIRGSLRAVDGRGVNVGRLAKLLGGGGHPKASGFALPSSLVTTEKGWKVVAPEEKTR